jgi:hypothetical protein
VELTLLELADACRASVVLKSNENANFLNSLEIIDSLYRNQMVAIEITVSGQLFCLGYSMSCVKHANCGHLTAWLSN